MSFLPIAFGWPLFLFPVHVVFLEFVIDPACSIVFEAEKGGDDAMARPPRDPAARLFDAGMLGWSLLLGTTLLVAVLAVYAAALSAGRGEGEARALAFAAIVAGNLALIFVNRSPTRSAWAMLREPNPALWWIAGGAALALALSLYAPPLASIFRFAPPAAPDLAAALAAGIAGVAWFEAWKRLRPRRPLSRAASG
jgi:Ca2+-transporting ATPase